MTEKDEKKPTPKTRSVKVPVSVVQRHSDTLLVEWAEKGVPMRGWIPRDAMQEGKAEKSVLASATPYGLSWEDVELPAVEPEKLAVNLRNAGIWTRDDLINKRQAAVGALLSTANISLAVLDQFAKENTSEDK